MFLTGSLTFTPRMCAYYDEHPLGGRVNLLVFSELKDLGVNRKHIFLSVVSG